MGSKEPVLVGFVNFVAEEHFFMGFLRQLRSGLLKTVKKPFDMLDMRYLSGRATPSRNTRCEIGCSRRAVLRPAIQGQCMYIKGFAKPHTIYMLLLGQKICLKFESFW